MAWSLLSAVGASRDLWVSPTTHGRPEPSTWELPDGRLPWEVLRTEGPDAVGVPIWWDRRKEVAAPG